MRQLGLSVIVALVLSGPVSLPAQDAPAARELTLDMAIQRPGAFYGRGPLGLQWQPDGRHLSWVERVEGGFNLVRQAATGGEMTTLLTLADLRDAAGTAGLQVTPMHLIQATWNADETLRLADGDSLYRIHLDPRKVEKLLTLPGGAEEVTWGPGDAQVVFVKDFDVHVRKSDGSLHQVTRGGSRDLTHGKSVSRSEFGITNGLWWDEAGRRLAFFREDLRPVDRYPLADFAARPAAVTGDRYPMAGRAGSVVSVGVYDSANDRVVWLETDPRTDEYLTNVTFGPRGERIYVARVCRDQNRTDLQAYDARTGRALEVLFTEKDGEWTEPEHGPIFLPDASGDFLWLSPRDGFDHLYRFTAKGKLVGQVTQGQFDVAAFKRFTADGKGLWFVTSGPDPRHQHLYHATLDGEQRAVTSGRGTHRVSISPDGGLMIDSHSNLELPLRVELLGGDGTVHRKIFEAKSPLEGFRLGKQSFFTTTTDDGQVIYGDVITPPDMEEGKKYPVLHYVYGGPHAQLVKDTWLGARGRWMPWLQYMATRGFVILRSDNRGTPNRGIEWEQSIFRRLGILEVKDQLTALDHVLAQGYADPERVGVHGWSYGGYMTVNLMTRVGDRYSCGVAGAPVTDWAYYETGYGERYMDTPQSNPDGYESARCESHIDGMKGSLLILHGGSDDVVVQQHTMAFVRACIEKGKDVDYMVYPGQKHGFSGPSWSHMVRKMTAYLERHLAGGE